MTLAVRLLACGVRDVGRRRWLLAFRSVMMTSFAFILGLVPLVSVIFGTMYLYHAREFIQMMLAQPVGRRSLFLGLYGGLAGPLTASFVIGVGVPLAWHGAIADAARPLVVLLATGAALSLVFTGLAFVIALACRDRAVGLAVAILVWLSATVLYDGLVLIAVIMLRDYPLEQPLLTGMLSNPVDLARVLLLMQFDLGALAGYTGAVFERFFGALQGSLWAAAALMLWISVPFAGGLRLFTRKDF